MQSVACKVVPREARPAGMGLSFALLFTILFCAFTMQNAFAVVNNVYDYTDQAYEACVAINGSGSSPGCHSCAFGTVIDGITYKNGWTDWSGCGGANWWHGQCYETEYLWEGVCVTDPPTCPNDSYGNPVTYDIILKQCPPETPPECPDGFAWSIPDEACQVVCPTGWTRDPLTETCFIDPIVCGFGEIPIIGFTGEVTGCLPAPNDEPCTNVQGTINGQEICADSAAACSATGGTFGYAGWGDTNSAVCLSGDYGSASCASGSVRVLDGPNDGHFTCQAPGSVPPSICNGQLYDCDNDGNIDDQNHNGIVDNGVLDGEGVPYVAPGTVPPNIGDDPLKSPKLGAGQCDPTSKNYAKCIGQATSSDFLGLKEAYNSAVDLGKINDAKTNMLQSVDDAAQWAISLGTQAGSDSVVPEGTEGNIDLIAWLFPSSNGCTDYVIPLIQGRTAVFPCDKLQQISSAVGVLMWLLLALHVRWILFQPRAL